METLIRDTWTTSGGHANNRILPRGVLISPANYLRFLHTLNSVYVANNSKIEDKKVRLEKLIQKIETISEQVKIQFQIVFLDICDHNILDHLS